MAITFDINKDIRFRQGIKEGEERGEERGKIEGLLEGIELALEIKFGANGIRSFKKIKRIDDLEKLAKIKNMIKKTDKLSEIKTVLVFSKFSSVPLRLRVRKKKRINVGLTQRLEGTEKRRKKTINEKHKENRRNNNEF